MEHDIYKDRSDEQLIEQLRSGQTKVMDYLMEKYKNLVRKRANALYLIGGETEDLIQEGMIVPKRTYLFIILRNCASTDRCIRQ